MTLSLLFGLLTICMIHGKFLLIDVVDLNTTIIEQMEKESKIGNDDNPQRIDGEYPSPWDTCNVCRRDGNSCIINECTKRRCNDGKKGPGGFCSVKQNNCADGFRCFRTSNICNNDVGRCSRTYQGNDSTRLCRYPPCRPARKSKGYSKANIASRIVERQDKESKLEANGQSKVSAEKYPSPWDTCNVCSSDGNGCITNECTTRGCTDGRKGPGEFCSVKQNNCAGDSKCFKRSDKCNNDVGKCLLT